MYWVVHSLITAYDSYFPVNPIPLGPKSRPCYTFRCSDGPIQSKDLFNRLVKPYFLKYEKILDKHLANLPADVKLFMAKAKDSDAVKNVMTMSKEQADKLIAEHGPEIMDKMMTIAKMQMNGELEKKAKEALEGLKKA